MDCPARFRQGTALLVALGLILGAGATWAEGASTTLRSAPRREIEPAPGQFATNTTYDSAAEIQHAAGLQVLQVFHDTPP
jgi:hypothetical protein